MKNTTAANHPSKMVDQLVNENIPEGTHRCRIIDVFKNDRQFGRYLKIDFEVVRGRIKGRRFSSWFLINDKRNKTLPTNIMSLAKAALNSNSSYCLPQLINQKVLVTAKKEDIGNGLGDSTVIVAFEAPKHPLKSSGK